MEERVTGLALEELEAQQVELLPGREEMLVADLAGVGNVAVNVNVGLVNTDVNQMAIAGSFNQA